MVTCFNLRYLIWTYKSKYIEYIIYLRPEMLPPNTFTITAVSTKLEIIINDPEIPGNINHVRQI